MPHIASLHGGALLLPYFMVGSGDNVLTRIRDAVSSSSASFALPLCSMASSPALTAERGEKNAPRSALDLILRASHKPLQLSPFRSLRRRHRGLCSQGIGGRRRRTHRRGRRAGRRPVPGAGRHRRVSDLDVRGAKVLLRAEERPRLLGHPVEAATTTQCTRSSVERGAGEICHLRKSITSGQL